MVLRCKTTLFFFNRKIEIAKGVATLTDELKESVNKLQQFNTEVEWPQLEYYHFILHIYSEEFLGLSFTSPYHITMSRYI